MRAPYSASLACLLLLAAGAAPPADWPQLRYRAAAEWPGLPAGKNFRETPGVAVDARGHVYVIHRGDQPVMEFDGEGKFVRSFGDGLFERPHAIRVDHEGNIWTVDDMGHVVLKLDPGGRVRMVLGRWKISSEVPSSMRPDPGIPQNLLGSRDDDVLRFNRPTDVAVAPSGEIYVSDGYGNSRVVKLSKDGRLLKTWGKRGNGPGEFNTPHSIALDGQGRVYVADRENYRIQVFDSEGTFLKQWTHVGAPWGLDITPDQKLYMADGYNNRVLELDLEGNVKGVFGSGGRLAGQFSFVHQLAVSKTGAIYTAEILNWRAQKFVPAR